MYLVLGYSFKVEKGLRFAYILAILTTFRPSNLCMLPGTCRKKFCSFCSVSLLPENPYFSSAGGAIRGANGRLHPFLSVLRIRDILVWIRIHGSVPDSRPDPGIFVRDLQDVTKNYIFLITFCSTFKSFFKDKKS